MQTPPSHAPKPPTKRPPLALAGIALLALIVCGSVGKTVYTHIRTDRDTRAFFDVNPEYKTGRVSLFIPIGRYYTVPLAQHDIKDSILFLDAIGAPETQRALVSSGRVFPAPLGLPCKVLAVGPNITMTNGSVAPEWVEVETPPTVDFPKQHGFVLGGWLHVDR